MFSQRGVALLLVAVGVTIVLTLAYEFDGSALIDYESSARARDDMQMEFNLRSGANLSRLLIKIQVDVLDKNREMLGGDPQIADFTGFFLGFFGGDREEVDGLAESLGGFSEDVIKTLGVANGRFDIQMGTEDGKLNLNCSNDDSKKDAIRTMLTALFYLDAYNPLFESPSADKWQRTREEQASAIVDYIDRDSTNAAQPGTPEQYDYEAGNDRYLAKNQRLDSLGELQQVRGIDDRMWTLFGKALTIYGPRTCTINIGSLSDPNLIAAIIALTAKDQNDPVVRDQRRLWALARRVSEAGAPAGAGGFGASWSTLEDFANFVKDPTGGLEALFSQQSAAGSEPTGDATRLGPQIEGVELDPQELAKIASAGPRVTYRIEVTAEIGVDDHLLRKRAIGVWDTQLTNQNQRNQTQTQGNWVFWREE